MLGYTEVIMNNSDLHRSLNTRNLTLIFENYSSVINSNVWLSKVKFDDRTEFTNNYSEFLDDWMKGHGFTEGQSDAERESVLSQWKEGSNITFEIDLEKHLSYLDKFKAKYSI
mgnify:CR=1 FL=1